MIAQDGSETAKLPPIRIGSYRHLPIKRIRLRGEQFVSAGVSGLNEEDDTSYGPTNGTNRMIPMMRWRVLTFIRILVLTHCRGGTRWPPVGTKLTRHEETGTFVYSSTVPEIDRRVATECHPYNVWRRILSMYPAPIHEKVGTRLPGLQANSRQGLQAQTDRFQVGLIGYQQL